MMDTQAETRTAKMYHVDIIQKTEISDINCDGCPLGVEFLAPPVVTRVRISMGRCKRYIMVATEREKYDLCIAIAENSGPIFFGEVSCLLDAMGYEPLRERDSEMMVTQAAEAILECCDEEVPVGQVKNALEAIVANHMIVAWNLLR